MHWFDIKVTIVSGNNLAPNRQQAITRAFDDQDHWQIYASSGLNELRLKPTMMPPRTNKIQVLFYCIFTITCCMQYHIIIKLLTFLVETLPALSSSNCSPFQEVHSKVTGSMASLLITWLLTLLGHQRPGYRLYPFRLTFSSLRVSFNHLCLLWMYHIQYL